ncbi:Gag-like protein [Elysia marginata]|uniref:Gag-like protein n=1 Tax=Elysia marginata TaxID=1093978 RepID=A0AAV4F4C2_9GAST|nr:Gag-like protein [Elysia marginata]
MDTQTKSFAESVRNTKRLYSQTPAKRRATDFYEAVAGTKKFINVESVGEEKITDLSPFQIYDELEGVLGRDPHISTTNRGLLIELRDENIEKKLLSLKAMAHVPVRASPDRLLNTSKGVVSHKDLLRCKEEEFIKKNFQESHSPNTSKNGGARR